MKEHCELSASLPVEEKPIRLDLIKCDDGYRMEVVDGERMMTLKAKSVGDMRDSLRRTLLLLNTTALKEI
jgi:hypothetical protein